MGYQLGIDLGTTYTAAAVTRSSDRRHVAPEVITLGSRSAAVASVLYLADDGSMLVGEAADRRALTDPDRVVREFKRRVGDPTPLVVAGRSWSPQDLLARLARWVVDRVAEREGGPAERIAVTHPASWGPHKQELLAEALAGQGIEASFLTEPEAAAVHYAASERLEPGSTIAVYDLGGGTFDAAVMRKEQDGFRLLGRPEGVDRLGGVDFDDLVFEHVRAGMPDAFDGLDDSDSAVLAAVAQVRRDCTEAKEALSSDTEASIPVLLPGAQGSVRLHRGEFEEMIRPYIEETVTALLRAVRSADLSPEELSAVLLVGGSSRIPLVAQLVSEQLDRPVAVDADPKNAIVKGAVLSLAPAPTPKPAVAPALPPPLETARKPEPAGMPSEAQQPLLTPLRGIPVVEASSAGESAAAASANRPVSPTPPQGIEPVTQRMAAPSGPQPPRPPLGPATEVLANTGPQRLSGSSFGVGDPGRRHGTNRRSVGLLAGVGGFVVISVVLIATFFWPSNHGQTAGTSGSEGTAVSATLPPAVAPASDPLIEEPPAGNSGNRGGNGAQTGNRGARGGAVRPPAQAPETKAEAPEPPVQTHEPPPTTQPQQNPTQDGDNHGSGDNHGGSGGTHGDPGTGNNGGTTNNNDNTDHGTSSGTGGGGMTGGTESETAGDSHRAPHS